MNDSDRNLLADLSTDLQNLTDRDSYIAWRNRWRQALAAQTVLVHQIRKARQIQGAFCRSENPLSEDSVEGAWLQTFAAGLKAQQNYKGAFYGFNSWRNLARELGRELNEIRKISKQKAAEAYQLQKAAKAASA